MARRGSATTPRKSAIWRSWCFRFTGVGCILTLSLQFSCPVCGQGLNDIGPAAAQEQHVRNCLEGGSGPGVVQAGKYIVYKVRSVRDHD
jgi:hypothetical protein